MAQTFNRVNKSRKESEEIDLRKSIISKQHKNLDKHRNSVYSMAVIHDEDEEDDDPHYDFVP